jgi:transcriptional regulator with XRE-family HTH domain
MEQITAPQVRQARAELGWSQRQLAGATGLAISTIAEFERGVRLPTVANLESMRAAMEKAGIVFQEDGGVSSLPIRLGNRPLAGGLADSRITATDFEQWTGRAAQHDLPRLVGLLIRAGAGAALRFCRFPWEDSVQHSGPDGRCEIDPAGCVYPREMLPLGASLWELTTEDAPPFGKRGKATREALKRRDQLTPQERSTITFVFATTRRVQHSQQEKWVRERRTADGWREVRVLDADALAEWVNLFPAVTAWLSERMRKPDAGCRRLEDALGGTGRVGRCRR